MTFLKTACSESGVSASESVVNDALTPAFGNAKIPAMRDQPSFLKEPCELELAELAEYLNVPCQRDTLNTPISSPRSSLRGSSGEDSPLRSPRAPQSNAGVTFGLITEDVAVELAAEMNSLQTILAERDHEIELLKFELARIDSTIGASAEECNDPNTPFLLVTEEEEVGFMAFTKKYPPMSEGLMSFARDIVNQHQRDQFINALTHPFIGSIDQAASLYMTEGDEAAHLIRCARVMSDTLTGKGAQQTIRISEQLHKILDKLAFDPNLDPQDEQGLSESSLGQVAVG